MKKILALIFLMGMGALFLTLSWSCINNDSTPTFPDYLQNNLVPTSTPCGYPGNTCTPTATIVTCAATPISIGNTVTGNTVFAGNNYTSSCGGTGPEIFYRFTLSIAHAVTITTCSPNTSFDTVLSVLTSCNPVTMLACNDDASPACGVNALNSTIMGTLPSGTYWIVVDGLGGASGQYELSLH